MRTYVRTNLDIAIFLTDSGFWAFGDIQRENATCNLKQNNTRRDDTQGLFLVFFNL